MTILWLQCDCSGVRCCWNITSDPQWFSVREVSTQAWASIFSGCPQCDPLILKQMGCLRVMEPFSTPGWDLTQELRCQIHVPQNFHWVSGCKVLVKLRNEICGPQRVSFRKKFTIAFIGGSLRERRQNSSRAGMGSWGQNTVELWVGVGEFWKDSRIWSEAWGREWACQSTWLNHSVPRSPLPAWLIFWHTASRQGWGNRTLFWCIWPPARTFSELLPWGPCLSCSH